MFQRDLKAATVRWAARDVMRQRARDEQPISKAFLTGGADRATGATVDDGAPPPAFLIRQAAQTSPVEQELAEMLHERGIRPARLGPPGAADPNRSVIRGVLSSAVERLVRRRTNDQSAAAENLVVDIVRPVPPIILEVDDMVAHLLDKEFTAKVRAAIESFTHHVRALMDANDAQAMQIADLEGELKEVRASRDRVCRENNALRERLHQLGTFAQSSAMAPQLAQQTMVESINDGYERNSVTDPAVAPLAEQ